MNPSRKHFSGFFIPLPPPPSSHRPSTRVTKFALRFHTLPRPSPPPTRPTMIQPLLIALPHYCPTFMALPLYRSFDVQRPPASHDCCPLPLSNVTYHSGRRAAQGMKCAPLPVEKVLLLQVRAGVRSAARLPGAKRGREGRAGGHQDRERAKHGDAVPSGTRICIFDTRS